MSFTRRRHSGISAVTAWTLIRIGRWVGLLGSQEGLAHIALAVDGSRGYCAGAGALLSDFRGRAFHRRGGKLYPMPLRKEKQYLIDFDEIPGDVADRAKLMVVSYPNNPTTASGSRLVV